MRKLNKIIAAIFLFSICFSSSLAHAAKWHLVERIINNYQTPDGTVSCITEVWALRGSDGTTVAMQSRFMGCERVLSF